uniref:Uncharacterized protein n=1 Tax=Oryza brachyantha TaxID=4533 RepID=J3MBH2_ORYBR
MHNHLFVAIRNQLSEYGQRIHWKPGWSRAGSMQTNYQDSVISNKPAPTSMSTSISKTFICTMHKSTYLQKLLYPNQSPAHALQKEFPMASLSIPCMFHVLIGKSFDFFFLLGNWLELTALLICPFEMHCIVNLLSTAPFALMFDP